MNIGAMKTRIEILQPIRTIDGQGGDTVKYTIFKTCWAYFRPIKGSEKFTQDQLENPTDVIAQIRYNLGNEALAEKCRVRFQGKMYRIINMSNLNNDFRTWELTLQKLRVDTDA